MGERVEPHRLSFNASVASEARDANQSSDAGLLLVRDVLERAGTIDRLGAGLHDPGDPRRLVHPLANQVRTVVGLLAQGWNDLADVASWRWTSTACPSPWPATRRARPTTVTMAGASTTR